MECAFQWSNSRLCHEGVRKAYNYSDVDMKNGMMTHFRGLIRKQLPPFAPTEESSDDV